MMHTVYGKYIIFFGVIIIIIGFIVYFFGDKLSWLGNLPGDIRIEKQNTRVYVPVTTMIILSVILTLLINLIRKLL